MSSTVPSYREKPPKLLGGVLCLDFVNTVSWRGDPRDRGERLTDYAELVAWAAHAGVVDSSHARRLAAAARRHPESARRVVDSAIELREALARLLIRVRRGAKADLAILNAMLAAAPPRSSIQARGSGFAWGKRAGEVALAGPLHPVLWSAADLLTSGRLSNVRACGDARCRWLFLDPSPSGRRRWCSMKECGNRFKARRHYRAASKSGRSRSG